MKTLSMIKENWTPNQTLGVTNHLTPVKNIISNINNLFASQLSIVAFPGADNVSLIVKSSFFYDEETTRSQIYQKVWNDRTSLFDYVSQQGLPVVKIFQLGTEWICMFCPSDMPQFGYGPDSSIEKCPASIKCEMKEQIPFGEVEYNSFVYEDGEDDDNDNMNGLKNYGFGDQEIESIQKKDLRTILGSKDKVKAAKAFAAILSKNMRMPENYYIKAVRDEDGNESVALRYRYEKRKPFGKTAMLTKTLVNIYGLDNNGIWVDGADDPNGLPEEMKGVIDDMLGFIGVKRTGDACCFTISENPDDGDDLKSDPDNLDNEDNENNNEQENNKDQDTEQKNKDDNGQGINTPQRTDKPSQVAANQADNSLSNSGIMRTDGSSM